MAKFSAAVLASLVACSAAFAPSQQAASQTALKATGYEEVGGVPFDPMSLAKLGTGEGFDTFPNVFPNEQFLMEAEIKHGRQAMLAWTGAWATHEVRDYVRDGGCYHILWPHRCGHRFTGRMWSWYAHPRIPNRA